MLLCNTNQETNAMFLYNDDELLWNAATTTDMDTAEAAAVSKSATASMEEKATTDYIVDKDEVVLAFALPGPKHHTINMKSILATTSLSGPFCSHHWHQFVLRADTCNGVHPSSGVVDYSLSNHAHTVGYNFEHNKRGESVG